MAKRCARAHLAAKSFAGGCEHLPHAQRHAKNGRRHQAIRRAAVGGAHAHTFEIGRQPRPIVAAFDIRAVARRQAHVDDEDEKKDEKSNDNRDEGRDAYKLPSLFYWQWRFVSRIFWIGSVWFLRVWRMGFKTRRAEKNGKYRM